MAEKCLTKYQNRQLLGKKTVSLFLKMYLFCPFFFQPDLYVHFDVLTLIPLITIKDDIPKQTELNKDYLRKKRP